MSRLCRFVVVLFAVVLAVVAAVSLQARTASAAPTLAPWESDTCFTSACVWSPSSGSYVAGGDGVSIESYVSGGGSWGGNVSAIVDQSGTLDAQAADVLPAFETVPGLQTIALGAA